MTAPMTRAQLVWRPDSSSWSVGHCVDHLIATGRLYHPRFEQALAQGLDTEKDEYRHSRLGKWFLAAVSPQSRLKARAPAAFRPAAEVPANVVTDFLDQQEELLSIIERSAGLDLKRSRVLSPVPLFKMRLGEALELVVVHQQRHIQQAHRVTQSVGYP